MIPSRGDIFSSGFFLPWATQAKPPCFPTETCALQATAIQYLFIEAPLGIGISIEAVLVVVKVSLWYTVKSSYTKDTFMAMTLVKYLAAHSDYSRRKAPDVIKEKRVSINGTMVQNPWREVKEGDEVCIDGKLVQPTKKSYVVLNKPEGVITTMADEEGRLAVDTLIKGAAKERLFPVGRLDKDTSGILLFTNDGELAQQLSHPKFQVTKKYQVTLDRPVKAEHLGMIVKGIRLPDGTVRADKAVYAPKKRKFVVIVELHSGKKRVIRRIFGKLGYIVRKLDRIGYAGLTKKGIVPGKWRHLNKEEVAALKKVAQGV